MKTINYRENFRNTARARIELPNELTQRGVFESWQNIRFFIEKLSSATKLFFGPMPLTPLEYFLWGYVKAHSYTDRPASIDALEGNIEAFIHEMPAEMLERVCQNWTSGWSI